ncbi:MAG: ABC transporter ATP-binding protein [Clostridia bacterium]|nr:ABC transporter ATP-binding protein [Clostridia bacterium]
MKRWLGYAKPYTKYFILGPLCMIVEVLGEVLLPRLYADIINNGIAGASIGRIILVCAMMVLCSILMMLGGIGGAYFGAKASVNFAADVRRDVFAKVQRFSFANIDRFSAGSLVTRLTNDVTQVMNFVNMLLRMFLRTPGMLIGALIMTITMKPDLAAVLGITLPLLLVVQFLVIRRGFPLFNRMQARIDALNTTVQENLTNVRVVKSFVREDFEQQKFDEANGNLKKAGLDALHNMVTMMPLMMLIMNITSVIVVWKGGNEVILGNMLVGDLSAFITYINQILMSLMMVSMMFMVSSRSITSARRIAEVLDEKIDLTDENAAQPEKQVEKGDVEFRNVTFRYYKNSVGTVLDDVSFTVHAGETLGIIGSTGSGKTTLVSMIPRLYDVDAGEVLVDGVNVKDYSLNHLRRGVGMVLQKNVLFSGTIEENLRWGDQDADGEEIVRAAQYAQADSFVRGFAKGYESDIEQGGSNVSGGQKQRLCIARALLRKPKILILDDSTSAVDTATEARIREAFANELKDSTKIIIAQRITSVMDADRILVLDEGKVTGIGTHDELLKTNQEYREIYESQMSGALEAGKEGA